MSLPQDDWDRHWHSYADSASTNPAEAYRRRLVLDRLQLGDGPARVLDIGSGQGDLLADVRRAHPKAELVGLELSRQGIEVARTKVPDATFVQCNLLEAGEPEPHLRGWATHAVCSEVLEHVERPDVLLANTLPYLAPGCRVVVTVPGGPRSAFDRHIGHRRHFRRSDVRSLLAGVGLEVESATGAGFPFFNLYRLTVVLRGQKLVDDVKAGDGAPASPVALAVMRAFGVLFAANLASSPWGWQMVALARTRP